MFNDDGTLISIADLFARADPSDIFVFDVDVSTHDALKEGIIATGIVQVAVTDVTSLVDASRVATGLAAVHGMPTQARLVRVII